MSVKREALDTARLHAPRSSEVLRLRRRRNRALRLSRRRQLRPLGNVLAALLPGPCPLLDARQGCVRGPCEGTGLLLTRSAGHRPDPASRLSPRLLGDRPADDPEARPGPEARASNSPPAHHLEITRAGNPGQTVVKSSQLRQLP